MQPWQSISVAIFGNATVLAVLGWIGKSLLEKIIQRDGKQFEIELQAKTDLSIEQFKSALQQSVFEQQIRFSTLHEKQANVISELNSLLVESLWEAESFLSPIQWAGEPDIRKKHTTAINKLIDLYRYFDKNRIYLPESICISLDELITEVRSHVISLGVYLNWDDSVLQEHTRKEKLEISKAGWHAIKNKIPDARKELEDAFRALLGQRT